jgi:general secretion pathway protein D
MATIISEISVPGSQRCPQGSDLLLGLATTPGSQMNRSLFRPGADALRKPALFFFSLLRSRLFRLGQFRLPVRIAAAFLLVLATLAAVPLHAQSANALFKRGVSAEAREDYDAAFDLYQQAQKKAPKDLAIRTALARVRVTDSAVHLTKGRKLAQAGDEQGALVELLHAAEIDPGNEAAQQEIAKLRVKHGEAASPGSEASLPQEAGTSEELDTMSSPVELKPISTEPLTLHYTGDAKDVYQAIGKAAGINVLFDPDYTSKRIQVDLTNMNLRDALRIVGTLSGTFWRPVTENTIFVAQNNRTKRGELDEQAIQTFYLSNAWQQNDLNDVQTALRNVLGASLKVYAVQSQNAIVVRGTPDELLLCQKLVNDLDKARAEVVVDIAVLEVSKNWERTLGIEWPSSVGIALNPPTSSTSSTSSTTSTTGTTTSTNNLTLYNLAHLKATDFAATIGSATANLLLTDSNTKILQNPRIRATDAQKAVMKIGERIPIATGSYQTGAATAVVSSLVNTQFTYQDVGVNIEMTPTVHYDRDVTLKIKIEVTSQSGSVTISGVTEPILSQRVVDQVIRLREGEATVLGGIQEKQEMVSWNGIPGLSSIPVLRYLFGSKDHTIDDDDLVFLVVPHVVRTQTLDQVNLRTIDTGPGNQTIELRHTPTASESAPATSPAVPQGLPANAPASANPAIPPGLANPTAPAHNFGVVPGQSAMAAAPAALAQMSASADANGQTAQNVAAHPPGSPSSPATPDAATPASTVALMFNGPTQPVAAGSTFQVPIVLLGGTDIASVPLQIHYDPASLSLVNVNPGDLLSRDGQAVALIHRDDGPGDITINAARPPGAAGVSGAGVVCVLSFQARVAGQSSLAMTRAAAVTSKQSVLPGKGSTVSITVK